MPRFERLPPDLAALRQIAVERPDDVGAHLVFADALSDRGYPLGEFIVAQSQRPRLDVPEHIAVALTGALFETTSYLGVRLGILRGVAMQHVAPSRFRRFIGYPALDAVEWIDLRRWPSALQLLGADVAEFLRHPVLSRLTSVDGLSREALAELAPHALKMKSIAIDDDPDGFVAPPRGALALAVEQLCFSTPDEDGAMVG